MTAKTLITFGFSHRNKELGVSDLREADVSEEEIREAFTRIMQDTIRPTLTSFSVVLLAASIISFFYPVNDRPFVVSFGCAVLGMAFLASGIAVKRHPVPSAWTHNVTAMIAGAGWLICMLVMYFSPEPYHTTSFMLLILSAGFLLLSTRWLLITISLTVLGWGSLVRIGESSKLWIHFGFALFVSTVLALVVHTIRLKTLRRAEIFRIRGEARRKELETTLFALKQSETQLRIMTEQLPAILWTTDLELKFTSALGMGLAVLGFQPNGAVGKSLFDYFPTTDPLYPPIDAHRNALNGKSKNFEIGWGGRLFDCHVEPLRDLEGEVIGVLGLGFDVTERKITETQIRILNEQLERRVIERTAELQLSQERNRALDHELHHAGRLTMMGELVASIAHEVNQPLCAIVNNANFCRRELERPDADLSEIRHAMKDIVESGSRASEIITHIRALLRKGEFEPALLKIDEIIGQVADLMRHESIKREVLFEIESAENIPPVLGDRVQLQQVILNLMINSFDAMNEIRPGERKLLIRSSLADHDQVLVEVCDNGAGIDPGELDRVFNAFYTTKPEGMGMGLSINQTIIRAHGGRMWATNNITQGATVQFTLPIFKRPDDD